MVVAVKDEHGLTASGKPRGFIQPHALEELWFHTGTACNLACSFCLEGSKPGDNRLQRITLADAQPLMDDALALGVRQFSFTGGEPFIVRDFINILRYAAKLRPCLVLTNGTRPLLRRLHQIATLKECAHPVSFRISIDWVDEARHDVERGNGSFQLSLEAMRRLIHMGFHVSLARQVEPDEDPVVVDQSFRELLVAHGIPEDIRIVSFPDFAIPDSHPEVPEITEDCMTRYHTEKSRRAFMCAFSKMVVKKNGRMRIYACTLVDDDIAFDQGGCLADALDRRVLLAHHRCYTCFAYGSSCSERD